MARCVHEEPLLLEVTSKPASPAINHVCVAGAYCGQVLAACQCE